MIVFTCPHSGTISRIDLRCIFISFQPKPITELLLRDLPRLAGCFLLSGSLAPGVKLLRRKRSGFHPGKPLLVLPAIILEHIIVFLAACPLGNSANFLAGAAFAVRGKWNSLF